MGLLKRMKSIVKSFGNACIERLEEPRRMLDQYLLEAEREVGEINEQATTVLADEEAVRRRYSECEKKIQDCERYALQASNQNQEEAALRFLETREQAKVLLQQLKEEKTMAAENSKRVMDLKTNAEFQLEYLRTRKDVLSSQIALNEAKTSANKGRNQFPEELTTENFDRLNEKVQRMSDIAKANEWLQKSSPQYSFEQLKRKYEKEEKRQHLLQELEELRAKENTIMESVS